MFTAVQEEVQKRVSRHTPSHGRELHLSCFLVLFFFFLDYHVDNGCLLEKTWNECGIEKIRILDSHGSVIVITRDRGHILVQNKYSIEPTTLTMDISSCNVMNNSNGYQWQLAYWNLLELWILIIARWLPIVFWPRANWFRNRAMVQALKSVRVSHAQHQPPRGTRTGRVLATIVAHFQCVNHP